MDKEKNVALIREMSPIGENEQLFTLMWKGVPLDLRMEMRVVDWDAETNKRTYIWKILYPFIPEIMADDAQEVKADLVEALDRYGDNGSDAFRQNIREVRVELPPEVVYTMESCKGSKIFGDPQRRLLLVHERDVDHSGTKEFVFEWKGIKLDLIMQMISESGDLKTRDAVFTWKIISFSIPSNVSEHAQEIKSDLAYCIDRYGSCGNISLRYMAKEIRIEFPPNLVG